MAGKSPFLVEDTSSNGWFFHCHIKFQGLSPKVAVEALGDGAPCSGNFNVSGQPEVAILSSEKKDGHCVKPQQL